MPVFVPGDFVFLFKPRLVEVWNCGNRFGSEILGFGGWGCFVKFLCMCVCPPRVSLKTPSDPNQPRLCMKNANTHERQDRVV
mmetsp:Transcript_22553/g.22877  ORF Transcript_22553/g.22877 Transcript_22553/m.22877 type:complete len:82 (-) Transcript_22553:95-340(-)